MSLAVVRLGARFAVAPGSTARRRLGLGVLGVAVGVVALVLAAGAAGLVPASTDDCGGLYSCTQRDRLGALLFLAAPVMVLLASIARLSATTRDRRLSALRLLGVSTGRTRLLAASETAVTALLGTLAGVAATLLLHFGLPADATGVSAALRTGWAALGVVALVVPLVVIVVATLPSRSATARPLAYRRGGAASRPRAWRLIPLAIGIALLVSVAVRHSPAETGVDDQAAPFLVGTLLTALAIPFAVPVVVRWCADFAARRARRAPTLLAARRLQAEPAASTRVVAGLLTAVFLAVGAQCVLVVFKELPQYRDAVQAETSGPQYLHVDSSAAPASRHALGPRLAAVDGVRSVAGHRIVDYRGATGGGVFIGTCAAAVAVMPGLTGCDEDTAQWVGDDPSARLSGSVTLVDDQDEGAVRTATVAPVRAIAPVDWKKMERGGMGVGTYSLRVPPTAAGLDAWFREPTSWLVAADGGPEVRDRLQAVKDTATTHPAVWTESDPAVLAFVGAVIASVNAATVAVLMVGLVAFGVGSIDRAAERRRPRIGLHVIGVPTRTIRLSQFGQMFAPLAIGIPVAGALGLLAGIAYLTVGGERAYLPLAEAVTLVGGLLVASALLALVTVPVAASRVHASDLRRE